MFKRPATFATVITIAMTVAPVAQGQGSAGRAGVAAAVRGDVVLVAAVPQQSKRTVGENVRSGDPVFLGDTIETGPDSGLQIMLMDETIFTIGPDAALIIDEFVYDPETSAGKVTASVLKGAFRFVSGRVAKDEPRNMNVKTPVGTIGIRGTSAAGRVIPANPNDPNSEISADIVLLGPGVDNNANERAGRIIVSNADTSVEISRSGFGTNIAGIDAPPTIPVRFDPGVVSGLTGDLGTSGGARPASPPAGGPDAQNGNDQSGDGNQPDGQAGPGTSQDNGTGSATARPAGPNAGAGSGPAGGSANDPVTAGGPATGGTAVAGGPTVGGGIGLGQATNLSGQNIGVSVINAGVLNQLGATQNQTQQLLLAAVEEGVGSFNNTITTFSQLQKIETGSATFNFGTVNLSYVSGAHTNSGGSYDSTAKIDFGARSIKLTVTNVSYFFNGGATQNFTFTDDVGGSPSFSGDTGKVSKTWDSSVDTAHFPTAPTDGSTAKVTATILNNTETGVIAAAGRVNVRIEDSGSTTVIAGANTVKKQ
ncbi:MAG: FecR domain-containing protein [Rhodospirillaceae bacterium]|nr:FecR domain-containing protein [Rhodospirillaceae bacterium]MBT3810150.1 FecR domain-containing protein [Rhodospirillaceae bacterium]MBT4771227.1 FecR domain-containing protein [Rhodospirillaceae bacterium]MBT5357071.1 FecR domain-containing protein [Rhodospirillaceae bacterium]MBT5769227.1 FecR domain-containing protein [Rhodospirillaceae bacterium]